MSSRKILGLAETLVGSAVSAARHPVATAGYVAGLAKGVTEATIGAVRGGASAPSMPAQRARVEPEPEPEPEPPTATTAPAGERTLYGGLNKEAAPPRMPGGGGESMAHEPHAESREVEHGEATFDPREADSWAEEALPDDDGDLPETANEPLLDSATASAIRSEAETLGRAADVDKGERP